MFYFTIYKSPIGEITLGSNGVNLIGLWIEGQKYHGSNLARKMVEKNDIPIFNSTIEWLDSYFTGEKPNVSELTLAPIGTEFRQKVWKILCKIPYGELITYGDIAKKIASEMNKKTMSAQAVGGAVGHNPISIIIPCHRVVGSNGSLTGYAGGISKKIKLLELEGVDISDLFVPSKGTAL
ncbi:MAG: methylated-DNA--[protein]-cysteine S-methyltransferase [Methanobrevibacter sp.]|nr:methylated-DNA--[protein]-cysteine S-methyltransferase [Methanobrevibacter sp.]